MQGGATMNQTVTGFVVGQTYEVTFWSSMRTGDVGGDAPVPMTVTANGATIWGPQEPTSDRNWDQYTTSPFTAAQTSYTFEFATQSQDYDGSDLLDDVHVVSIPSTSIRKARLR